MTGYAGLIVPFDFTSSVRYFDTRKNASMLVRQRIAQERKRNGMTAAELAEILKVNRGTVSRWENGFIKSIPADTLRKLAEVFDLSLEELIGTDADYFYLLPEKTKTQKQSLSELTADEAAMLEWYRHLTASEKKIVSKMWLKD